jgi:Phosphoesterase family
LVVSPFAKRNHVDHTLTDQTSVLRFIEDNWLSGERIQRGGSFDAIAGSLNNMFDFDDRDEGGPRKIVARRKDRDRGFGFRRRRPSPQLKPWDLINRSRCSARLLFRRGASRLAGTMLM